MAGAGVPYLAEKLAAYETVEAVTGVNPADAVTGAVKKVAGAYTSGLRRGYNDLLAASEKFGRIDSPQRPRKRMRTYNKRRRFEPSMKRKSKSYQDQDDQGAGVNVVLGRLYNLKLPVPPINNNSAVNSSEGMTMLVRGWKLHRMFYYNKAITTGTQLLTWENVCIHYALIQWECPIEQADINNLLPKKFFRWTEVTGLGAGQKSIQFGKDEQSEDNMYPTQEDPWSFKLNHSSMNPDNGYRVIFHKKKVLRPRTGTINGMNNYSWRFNKYLKLNKVMETQDRDDREFKKPVLEVWWANTVTPLSHPTDTTAASHVDSIKTSKLHTCYFKDLD